MTTVPDWLTTRLGLTPERVAIEGAEGQSVSWSEVAALVAHAHDTLLPSDITPSDRVALLMSNGLPFAVTVHALIQRGAVTVPLNRRLTPSELTWQIRDSGAKILITDDRHSDLARESTRDVSDVPLCIYTPPASSDTGTTELPRKSIDLDDVHTVLYTSGTTGNPKGVLLTYGNHWWSAMGSALNLGVREDDKWLLLLPMFHAGGLSMLFKNVIYGHTVQIHERFDPTAVNRAIEEDGITHVSLVATMLQRLLDARPETPTPPTLRAILLGGGPCPQPLLERCARLGIPVVQTYGMTETASQSVTLSPGEALRKLGSAGKPLFMTELQIAVEGEPAAGQIGEILIRGPNVTPGYAGRPDATAERIRDGWLHTGDMGFLDGEGYLYVVNRRSDLIISGGENIYPAEVEAALLSHPGVLEAAVAGIPDEEWGQRVGAAVVLAPESAIEPEILRAYVSERLASYKVPREILIVEELPRNAAGKILRHLVASQFAS